MALIWTDISGPSCADYSPGSNNYPPWHAQSFEPVFACDPGSPQSGFSAPPTPAGVGPTWYHDYLTNWAYPDVASYGGGRWLVSYSGYYGQDVIEYPTATKIRFKYYRPGGLDGVDWGVLMHKGLDGLDAAGTVVPASVATALDGYTMQFEIDIPAGMGLMSGSSANNNTPIVLSAGPNPNGGIFQIEVGVPGASAFWTDFDGCRENF